MIKAGTQIWNKDHTEGYELLTHIVPGTWISSDMFKPLGNAEKPILHTLMPEWLIDGLIAAERKG